MGPTSADIQALTAAIQALVALLDSIFSTPSASDLASVFSWSFSLVFMAWLVSWAAGKIVRMIPGR